MNLCNYVYKRGKFKGQSCNSNCINEKCYIHSEKKRYLKRYYDTNKNTSINSNCPNAIKKTPGKTLQPFKNNHQDIYNEYFQVVTHACLMYIVPKCGIYTKELERKLVEADERLIFGCLGHEGGLSVYLTEPEIKCFEQLDKKNVYIHPDDAEIRFQYTGDGNLNDMIVMVLFPKYGVPKSVINNLANYLLHSDDWYLVKTTIPWMNYKITPKKTYLTNFDHQKKIDAVTFLKHYH